MDEHLKNRRTLMAKTDFLILAAVILVFVLMLFFTYSRDTGNMYAVITVNGKIVNKINLETVTQAYTLRIDGDYPCEILIEKGAVTVVSASCPDKICKNSGRMTRIGMQAVCLPNRMSVRIEGEGTQNSLDAITE